MVNGQLRAKWHGPKLPIEHDLSAKLSVGQALQGASVQGSLAMPVGVTLNQGHRRMQRNKHKKRRVISQTDSNMYCAFKHLSRASTPTIAALVLSSRTLMLSGADDYCQQLLTVYPF